MDVDLPAEYLESLEEIQIVAAGTSYHAGLYAQHLAETNADIRVSVEVASEYEFDGGQDPWRTLVGAVTQSGETADALSAIHKAARAGARTVSVTNTIGSTVKREVDDSVFIRGGPEIGNAATETSCSQVATLTLLRVTPGWMTAGMSSETAGQLLDNLRGLLGTIQQVLHREDAVSEVVED